VKQTQYETNQNHVLHVLGAYSAAFATSASLSKHTDTHTHTHTHTQIHFAKLWIKGAI